jgi:hypothetical protein
MSPIVSELVARNGSHDAQDRLRWSLALGSNASAIGTSDHVIVLGASPNATGGASRSGSEYRVVVTMIAVAISTGYLWLRCFSLA